MNNYLPIGTIVTLKGATKKIMIVGYCPINKDNVMYDYSAVTFPEGLISSNNVLAFNKDKIDVINYTGLNNEESQKFSSYVQNTVRGISDLKKVKLPKE